MDSCGLGIGVVWLVRNGCLVASSRLSETRAESGSKNLTQQESGSQQAQEKRERRTTTAPTTPTKGRTRTAHGRRSPFGERPSKHCFLCLKSLAAQVGRLVGSRTDVRNVFGLSMWPLGHEIFIS